MDFNKLFDWYYLTHRLPPGGFSWPLRIGLGILFVGAIIVAIYSIKNLKKSSGWMKKLWYKLQVWGWTTGAVGLLLFFFREVRALYFSSRIYMFAWVLITIIWLIAVLIHWKLTTPNKEALAKKQEEYDKWLPNKK